LGDKKYKHSFIIENVSAKW